ncbi:hypothetical protein [Roseateles violae]|uniref:Uncharacterized protein n=1 Tax=Roseateles violae TaxID=3058042 RepID=A0ABT8DSD5_9BURK|nr:hypothetical protein [Pelomonas sp. PFR6]MDN3921237.1 hypothetical protein [Pelomonas sp. PFR6]
MTSPEQAAGLSAQAQALREQLRQGLIDGAPLAELQALRTRLQLIEEALASARRPSWRRQLLALAIVAALVSLVALWPMPRVQFALEAEAGAAQLRLEEAGQLGAQALAGDLRAEGYGRLESADAGLMQRAREEGLSPLLLRAERLKLRSLELGQGARLDIEAGSAGARLAIEGAAHAVAFEFGGAVASSLGGAARTTAQVPMAEWLRLSAEGGATELWLPRAAGQIWPWRGLRPSALRFVERAPGAGGKVELLSALRAATLRLPAVERELQLGAGSTLELDGLRVEQCELQLGDSLRLKLSGSAGAIRSATGGFARSLSPSLLEYLAHNHSLGLLWSAAGLLWGISTWLRKQFAAQA